MICFCWLVAGGKDLPFPEGDGVYKVLYAYSKGVPRKAVKICNVVLDELVSKNRRMATVEDFERSAQELRMTA